MIVYSNTGYDFDIGTSYPEVEPNFTVHCCGRYKLITKPHYHIQRPEGTADFQILYVAQGTIHANIHNQEHVVTEGHILLYPPHEFQEYYYELKEQPDVYWLHFTYEKETLFQDFIQKEQPSILFVGIDEKYNKTMDKIIREIQLREPLYHEKITCLLHELLIDFKRGYDSTAQLISYDAFVENAIRDFKRHPEYNFSLKEYSKNHAINYHSFIRRFTNYTGISPRQYITNIRIEKAKSLLANNDFTIAEIAGFVGYQDALYFSRIFKKETGYSPSQYRKRLFTI
ncbi:MAG: helix-turn-helix domain-containing protein [Lachnospiraceae bacterium]